MIHLLSLCDKKQKLSPGNGDHAMKMRKRFQVTLVIMVGFGFAPGGEPVQACGTCKLSKGVDVTLLNGQLVIPGQIGENPFHWGVSYEENPPLPISITASGNTFTANSISRIATDPSDPNYNRLNKDAVDTLRMLSRQRGDSTIYMPHEDHIDIAMIEADHIDLFEAILSDSGETENGVTHDSLGAGFGASPVPEPAAILLLSIGLFAGFKCRRPRKDEQ